MDVYWLEQGEADVARNDDWFSAGEKACLDAKRFPKRRADWRLGRWTAKRALAVYLDRPGDLPSLAHIEICPAPTGAPEADQPAGVTISLSHREGTALCAIAAPDAQLGCDLERVEPRSEAFVADYFTDEEQALIAGLPATDRPQLLALLWSAKESVLKALHEGLRRDTRSVTVSLGGPAEGSEVGGTPRGGPALSLPQDEAGWHPGGARRVGYCERWLVPHHQPCQLPCGFPSRGLGAFNLVLLSVDSLFLASPEYLRPSRARWYIPCAADCPQPAPSEIRHHSTKPSAYLDQAPALRCPAQ